MIPMWLGHMATGMTRRRFMSALGCAATLSPLAAHAQSGRPSQIGFLYQGMAAMAATRITALRDGLRSVGYRDADQVSILERSTEGDPERLAPMVADLIQRKVDVIVAVSRPAVQAARSATAVIPIIAIDLESDPVGSGFVASLAHPGGNITGVFSDFPDFAMKWLELLKEAIPTLSSATVLWDPSTGSTQLDAAMAAGRLLNVRLSVMEVRAFAELEGVFQAVGQQRPDAIVILSSPIFGTNPRVIAELTLARRIPTASLYPEVARAGGLMAYGPNLLGAFSRTGTIVGKILQGIRPEEVPVERPTKFEMVINLVTARALGVTIPPLLLAGADEVID